jgi:hypothetical protein
MLFVKSGLYDKKLFSTKQLSKYISNNFFLLRNCNRRVLDASQTRINAVFQYVTPNQSHHIIQYIPLEIKCIRLKLLLTTTTTSRVDLRNISVIDR